jgi:3-dehydroquinate dehydratase type I
MDDKTNGDDELSTPPSVGNRPFASDASVVLVGIRGTGKSTLALLATTALKFRLVDLGTLFQSRTGQTRAEYAATHGITDYRRQEVELVRSVLQQHPKRTVIVLGSGSVEAGGQELIAEFAKRHPVILVMRDPSEISRYIGSCDSKTIADLINLSILTFRRMSNFEFFNLSNLSFTEQQDQVWRESNLQPYLRLKNIERDFLRLLHAIRGEAPREYDDLASHSLASVPPERRQLSYSLCLPIGQASRLAEQLHQSDLLADAIELVIDMPENNSFSLDQCWTSDITRQYYITRRAFRLPIIMHIKLPTTYPSSKHDTDAQYQKMIALVLRLAPEYFTVDFHLPDEAIHNIVTNSAHSKVIGHYYEPRPEPHAWLSMAPKSLLHRMKNLSVDIGRLCQTAISREDNRAVQDFLHYARSFEQGNIPVIAYNTGRLGRTSCFLNTVLSPVTHPLLKGHDAHASQNRNDLLTVEEAQNALYSSFTLEPQFFGIFGTDVLSSLSPVIHNAAFKAFRMPHEYLTLQCSSLKDLERLLGNANFGGASITAPFKQDIITVIEHLSGASQAIGAVNTILPMRSTGSDGLLARSETGKIVALYGDNTDWIGVYSCIYQHLSPVNTIRNGTTGLVIGAGGMAHAAVYSMIRLGIKTIFVCNRTTESASALAKRFDGKIYSANHTISNGPGQVQVTEGLTYGPSHVHILPALEGNWPRSEPRPTVIVSCVPAVSDHGPTNITVPEDWLANKTGGVLVEVSSLCLRCCDLFTKTFTDKICAVGI